MAVNVTVAATGGVGVTVTGETGGCWLGDRCRRETREELIAVLTQGCGGGGLWGAGCQP